MSDTERNVHELGNILEAILNGQGEIRKPAEARLEVLAGKAPADVLYGLALIGQGVAAYPIESRILALVLLRRQAFNALPGSTDGHSAPLFPSLSGSAVETPFDALSEPARERIEQCLLASLENEHDGRIRKGLAEVLGKWVAESGKRGRPLTQLAPLLLRLTSSPSPLHRLTTFQLLASTPTLLSHTPLVLPPSTAPSQITPEQIAHVLETGMHDAVVNVRVQAIKAAVEVLGSHDVMDRRAAERVGKPLVARAVETLVQLAGDGVHFEPATLDLLGLAYNYPGLFSGSLGTLFPLLHALCTPPASAAPLLPPVLQPAHYGGGQSCPPVTFPVDDPRSQPGASLESLQEAEETRFKTALEFLLTLIESQPKKTMKKWYGAQAGVQLIPVLLGRMILGLGPQEGDEAEVKLQEWLEQEDMDEDDENYPVIPEEGLDRLAVMMPANKCLEVLFQYLTQLISSPDWRARHVAFMAISCVGEGTYDVMNGSMGQVLQMVLALREDPHPRVRYAVCHCLGQLATDFEDNFLAEMAPQILHTEVSLLGAPEARVKAHAAASLVNLADIATAEIIRPYLDGIINGILTLLQNTPLFVQEQALTTLATIAITAEQDFGKYYSTIMPSLLQLLRDPSTSGKEYRTLRARGMEGCGLIGMAVGKDVFHNDAMELANIMAQIQANITDDDDPQLSYLTTTWSKLATCLKADFVPFLSHVLPPVLVKAAQKPEMIRIDKNDPNEVADPSYEILDISQDEQVGIKTSSMEDKATAFEVLAIYIVELGVSFAPYVEQTLDLCLEGLRFLFDSRVREASANMLPPLLQISKEVGNVAPAEKIFTALNTAILREDEMEFLALLFMKFTECMGIITTALPLAICQAFQVGTEFQLRAIADARQERLDGWDEFDAAMREAEKEFQELEEYALNEMSKTIHLLDPNSNVLLMLGSVRELGGRIPIPEEWEDAGLDEED